MRALTVPVVVVGAARFVIKFMRSNKTDRTAAPSSGTANPHTSWHLYNLTCLHVVQL